MIDCSLADVFVFGFCLLQVGKRKKNAEPRNELLLGIHTSMVSLCHLIDMLFTIFSYSIFHCDIFIGDDYSYHLLNQNTLVFHLGAELKILCLLLLKRCDIVYWPTLLNTAG